MKIAFVLIVHTPEDERVWFQQAKALKEAGQEVFIISACTISSTLPDTYCFEGRNLPKKELIGKIASTLQEQEPDVVICDNPLAVLGARIYKKKTTKKVRILYDVTEWYPSKKNLVGLPLLKKVGKAFLLSVVSWYTAIFPDGFIFGEYHKGKPFRLFFPWKKYIYLSYYADIKVIKQHPLRDIRKECNLFYSGNMTEEKGFKNVLAVAFSCADRFPETNFVLQIISGTKEYVLPDNLPSNLRIITTDFLPFNLFCEEIGKADIFLDLRENDCENTRCLPIKLFYYMASGRPIIYSDLKAISKAVPEINDIGFLVNPQNTEGITDNISRYLTEPEFYKKQAYTACKLAKEKYNWENIEHGFLMFISEG
jgi:glycosyltransferase involved in cell wall biosynthesis